MDLSNFLKVFLICFLLLQQNTLALVQILGGRSTTMDKVPYIVQIYKNGNFICGGSLISDYLVVTAAHCFPHVPVKAFFVVVGAIKTSDVGTKSDVTNVFWHPEFKRTNLHMDVAVVKLKTSFTNILKPIDCEANMKAGTPIEIFGWGMMFKGEKHVSKNLRTDNFVIMSHDECIKYTKGEITQSMFCNMAYQRGVYRGDSGSPVLCDGCFCGIVSWFFENNGGKHVSVHTNLAKVMQFIKTIKESNA